MAAADIMRMAEGLVGALWTAGVEIDFVQEQAGEVRCSAAAAVPDVRHGHGQSLPGAEGLEALQLAGLVGNPLPEPGQHPGAMAAFLLQGAERLLVTIKNVLSQTRLRDENKTLKRAVEARYQMVGESASLEDIRALSRIYERIIVKALS